MLTKRVVRSIMARFDAIASDCSALFSTVASYRGRNADCREEMVTKEQHRQFKGDLLYSMTDRFSILILTFRSLAGALMMEMVSGASERLWFVLSDRAFVQGLLMDLFRDGRRSFNGDGDWINLGNLNHINFRLPAAD